jgi:glutaredoxin
MSDEMAGEDARGPGAEAAARTADGAAARVAVKFYTRAGCHLCEEARREIDAAGVSQLFRLEEVDIDTDPELVRRHGWDIPVVSIDGRLAFKHGLTREDFRREIEHALAVREL